MPETENHEQQILSDAIATVRENGSEAASAEVTLPPGLRKVILTPEAAEAIRAVLDDQESPAHEGREMPTADAAVLLKKSQ